MLEQALLSAILNKLRDGQRDDVPERRDAERAAVVRRRAAAAPRPWGRTALALLGALAWAAPAAGQAAGIAAATDAVPPAGPAYHGGTHVFLSGQALLTCSSHGGFTSAAAPSRRTGGTVVSEYTATFTGELVLAPPAVATPATHALAVPAHMVERITLASSRRGTRVLDAELTALDLRGPGMPEGVLVRESPTKPSTGRYVITSVRHGYRVEGAYDVWLDLSLDGGRSWHAAEGVVRMSLAPEVTPIPARVTGR